MSYNFGAKYKTNYKNIAQFLSLNPMYKLYISCEKNYLMINRNESELNTISISLITSFLLNKNQ